MITKQQAQLFARELAKKCSRLGLRSRRHKAQHRVTHRFYRTLPDVGHEFTVRKGKRNVGRIVIGEKRPDVPDVIAHYVLPDHSCNGVRVDKKGRVRLTIGEKKRRAKERRKALLAAAEFRRTH